MVYIPRIPPPAVSCEPTNDFAWLAYIRSGTPLVMLGMACWVIGKMLAPFMTSYPADSHLNPARTHMFPIAITLAGWIVLLLGVWKLTAADSVRKHSVWLSLPRWACRVGLLAGLGAQVIDAVQTMVTLDRATYNALSGIGYLLGMLGMLGFFAMGNYIVRLAPIALTPGIKAFANITMFGLAICYSLSLSIPMLARSSGQPTVADFGAGCVMLLAMLGTFVFTLLTIVMINSVRVHLGRVVNASEMQPARVGM